MSSAWPDYSQSPEKPDVCPRCGKAWEVGDWPFCSGDPADHEQPNYTWHWGEGGPYTRKGA